MSMLEALDVFNEDLILKGEEPIAFEHDCREGICGSCGFMINGDRPRPANRDHGLPVACVISKTAKIFCSSRGAPRVPRPARSDGRPRSFDRIVAAGGYISVPTGSAPDGNIDPRPKDDAEASMDAAACIGCGACVAACPNASASAVHRRKNLAPRPAPPGQPERDSRALRMVRQMNLESFGQCTNIGECEAGVPQRNPARSHRPHERRLPKSLHHRTPRIHLPRRRLTSQ